MKYLGQQNRRILDRDWQFLFCTKETYADIAPKGSKAVTNTEYRKVYFDCSAVNHEDAVVVHELVHVYAFELMGHDINIDHQGDSEEYFASLFERRGEDILRMAKPLTKELMKHANKLKKQKGNKTDGTENECIDDKGEAKATGNKPACG